MRRPQDKHITGPPQFHCCSPFASSYPATTPSHHNIPGTWLDDTPALKRRHCACSLCIPFSLILLRFIYLVWAYFPPLYTCLLLLHLPFWRATTLAFRQTILVLPGCRRRRTGCQHYCRLPQHERGRTRLPPPPTFITSSTYARGDIPSSVRHTASPRRAARSSTFDMYAMRQRPSTKRRKCLLLSLFTTLPPDGITTTVVW